MSPVEPTSEAWGAAADDLDGQYARRVFMGISEAIAIARFAENPVSRSEDLMHMPSSVLPFYLSAFAKFLLELEPPTLDAADAASCFISVCEVRAPDLGASLCGGVIGAALDRAATCQDYFDAPKEIYGDFELRVTAIRQKTAR